MAKTIDAILKDIDSMSMDDCNEVANALSRRILIANWFDKGAMESLLNEELTDSSFQKIVDEWKEYGEWDDISETVRAWASVIYR
jgi:hypothetical protein